MRSKLCDKIDTVSRKVYDIVILTPYALMVSVIGAFHTGATRHSSRNVRTYRYRFARLQRAGTSQGAAGTRAKSSPKTVGRL